MVVKWWAAFCVNLIRLTMFVEMVPPFLTFKESGGEKTDKFGMQRWNHEQPCQRGCCWHFHLDYKWNASSCTSEWNSRGVLTSNFTKITKLVQEVSEITNKLHICACFSRFICQPGFRTLVNVISMLPEVSQIVSMELDLGPVRRNIRLYERLFAGTVTHWASYVCLPDCLCFTTVLLQHGLILRRLVCQIFPATFPISSSILSSFHLQYSHF